MLEKETSLSTSQVAEYFERTGKKVIESQSGFWHDAGWSVYLNIPYHRTISCSEDEAESIFRLYRPAGIKFSALPTKTGRCGGIYFCNDNTYSIHSLHKKMRAPVRRGIENCRVDEIDFDYLRRNGMRLNTETLARHGRADREFSNPTQWAQICAAGQVIDAVQVWGAFGEDGLAAYAITFRTEGNLNISHQFSRTKYLPLKPNHALVFKLTKMAISSLDIDQVSYGLEPLFPQPGLDLFKKRMGFETKPVSYVVKLHPLLRQLVFNKPSEFALQAAKKIAAGSTPIKKVIETLGIALESRDSLSA